MVGLRGLRPTACGPPCRREAGPRRRDDRRQQSRAAESGPARSLLVAQADHGSPASSAAKREPAYARSSVTPTPPVADGLACPVPGIDHRTHRILPAYYARPAAPDLYVFGDEFLPSRQGRRFQRPSDSAALHRQGPQHLLGPWHRSGPCRKGYRHWRPPWSSGAGCAQPPKTAMQIAPSFCPTVAAPSGVMPPALPCAATPSSL